MNNKSVRVDPAEGPLELGGAVPPRQSGDTFIMDGAHNFEMVSVDGDVPKPSYVTGMMEEAMTVDQQIKNIIGEYVDSDSGTGPSEYGSAAIFASTASSGDVHERRNDPSMIDGSPTSRHAKSVLGVGGTDRRNEPSMIDASPAPKVELD